MERALKHGRKLGYDAELVVHHRVPKERMRLSYFGRWAFVTGRADALRGLTGKSRFPVFGRPFWLYRRMAVLLGEWLLAFVLPRPTALQLQFDLLNQAGRLWWYREGTRRTRSGS